MHWLTENLSWLIAAVIIPLVAALISKSWKKKSQPQKHQQPISEEVFTPQGMIQTANNNNNNHNITINTGFPINKAFDSYDKQPNENLIDRAKNNLKILFIDDDVKFRVVAILKRSGWINTKSIKDVVNLDDLQIKEADIFFVDIHGVGKALDFKDEGLGLALALKKKYPLKKLVIYSSESKGDRFHEGLRNADSFLPKNAEPYEFQNLVEEFSIDILSE